MAELNEDQDGRVLSIGERLRSAREAKGLSLDDVATRTRIPIRHLQHIEKGEWDALPAVTYSIGFAKSYAAIVGLNGAEIGRELREQIGSPRPHAQAAEYYEPADPARVPPRWLAAVAALIAVLLIGGYFIWRSGLDGAGDGVASVDVPVAEEQAAVPQPPPQPQPASLAGRPVTLVATDEVWLRISDGGGSSLFQGILRAGERFDVPPTAQAPVLRTARPQVLRANVGGRDLGPIEPEERVVSDVSLRAEDLAGRLQGGAAPGPAPQPAPAG